MIPLEECKSKFGDYLGIQNITQKQICAGGIKGKFTIFIRFRLGKDGSLKIYQTKLYLFTASSDILRRPQKGPSSSYYLTLLRGFSFGRFHYNEA